MLLVRRGSTPMARGWVMVMSKSYPSEAMKRPELLDLRRNRGQAADCTG